MTEDAVTENAVLFNEGKDISYMEIGCDDVTISCTPGKIILWFGRQVDESVIRKVFFCISNIDPSVYHEQELICDFKNISEYEHVGYVLISYAKTKSGYMAVFRIPFLKKVAMSHFVEGIVDQLKEKDIKKALHWEGSQDRMILLYNEFRKFDGWRIKRIDYKDAGEKGV